jgi:hypothetical protein
MPGSHLMPLLVTLIAASIMAVACAESHMGERVRALCMCVPVCLCMLKRV